MHFNCILFCLIIILVLSFTASAGSFSFFDDLPKLKDYEAKRESSSDLDWEHGNVDSRPIPAGETLTIADIKGPGQIVHIWFTIAQPEPAYGKKLILRIYWDGLEHPSVECPINDFFCQGHGLDAEVNSMPIRVTSAGRARNSFFPMPFKKSAKITITNEGKYQTNAFFYYVNWQKLESIDDDIGYFHAQYRQEFPTSEGDYLILDAEGRGHFVGCNLSIRQRRFSWWGEGDDRFYIDGEKVPSILGTGAEDYFSDAWGIRKIDGLFYGCTINEGFDPLSRHTCYRFHIQDPIPFKESLKMVIEHKGAFVRDDGSFTGYDVRYDDYSSVAYWYQTLPHKPFPPFPSVEERFHNSIYIEAEGLIDSVTTENGSFSKQNLFGWSRDHHLLFSSTSTPAEFSMEFDVKKQGQYLVLAFISRAPEYGIYEIYVNGAKTAERDAYASIITSPMCVRLGILSLNEGKNTITFKTNSKNMLSNGYNIGVDYIELQEMPEYLEK